MKIVIIDDEEHVREGIDLAVDWKKFGIEERWFAENGQEALELIHLHRPAIVFCDMNMPGVHGRELLRKIRDEDEDVQIIVVSGHDDYEYTRMTIQVNGVDYILKPFARRDLEEAVLKAIQAWKEKRASQEKSRETDYKLKKADGLLDEQRLAAFFKGELHFHQGMKQVFTKIGLYRDTLGLAVVVPRNRRELLDHKYQGDGELLFFAVNNIIHEKMHDAGKHYLIRMNDYEWILLLALRDYAKSESEMDRLLTDLRNAWKNTMGLDAFIGRSQPNAPLDKLQDAVNEARQILLNQPIHTATDKRIGSRQGEELPRLSDRQFKLLTSLTTGDKSYAAEVIRSFTNQLRQVPALRLRDLQAYTVEGNLLMQRTCVDQSIPIEDVLLPIWISRLEDWEMSFIQSWWMIMEEAAQEGSNLQAIQRIHSYIERHFYEEISLSLLSERFSYSPQYIAKKFKETYKKTVMTHISELRIKKAESLLERTNQSVAEIANKVGYTDENYFGKVFKKYNQVSPLQYRKENRDS